MVKFSSRWRLNRVEFEKNHMKLAMNINFAGKNCTIIINE